MKESKARKKTTIEEMRESVGKRVYLMRESVGASQEKFASLLGISKQTFNNIENGKGSIKIEYLALISQYCGCDIGYLLGECDFTSYDNSFIASVTGLNEKAINELKNKTAFIKKIGKENEPHTDYRIFIDILNNFITSIESPIYEIGEYKYNIENKRQIEKKPYFKEARNLFLSAREHWKNEDIKQRSGSMFNYFEHKAENKFNNSDLVNIFTEMLYYDISCTPEVLELHRARMIVALDNYLKSF